MITLWPLIKYEDKWSIPDELLVDVWIQLVDKGREKELFYDGVVETAQEWLDYLKSPNQFVVFAVDAEKKKFIGVGWLNNIQDGTAESHFCYFDRCIPSAGEEVIKLWAKTLPLKVIYGHTPESYETVLKLLQRWGFEKIGTIPNFCGMKYKNIREGAVVSYRSMEDVNGQG